jgi:hypothetical protein
MQLETYTLKNTGVLLLWSSSAATVGDPTFYTYSLFLIPLYMNPVGGVKHFEKGRKLARYTCHHQTYSQKLEKKPVRLSATS